ncbi:MAG: DNA-binding transcriptional regulator Fis [Gammaproteobacteria bacterium]|jgi:Fis family transcriptional regulator|nr:DNA-binding transcriptional regulator Fis [Gammaproteobacteria bacterium]
MTTRSEGPLAACVKNALERYFRELDGEDAIDLYDMVLAQMEKPLLEMVMNHTGSNQCKAAEMLGINRNTLRKKLKSHGLSNGIPRKKTKRKR